MLPPLAALVLASLVGGAPPAVAGDRWSWPVRGEVITPFHVAGNPYAAGQHRGVDLAARAGEQVRSACAGTVRHAGPVPGRGRVVAVACGRLVATHLELGAVAVVRGQRIPAGWVVGTAAASHVQLGARRAGERFGHLDPLRLLAATGPPVGTMPVPRGGPSRRARRRAVRRLPRMPAAVRRPSFGRGAPTRARAGWRGRRPGPQVVARPGPRRVPPAAWAGLALLAAGAPLAVRRRRAPRRAAEPLRGRA